MCSGGFGEVGAIKPKVLMIVPKSKKHAIRTDGVSVLGVSVTGSSLLNNGKQLQKF